MGTHQLVIRTRHLLLAGIITVLSMCLPVVGGVMPLALAEGATCTPPSGGTGVQRPVGADAGTFTYNCTGVYTGQWTSPYYVYDPATGSRTPLYSPDYSYDCATHFWTKTEWAYSPASGKFFASRVVTTPPPSEATNCPAPVDSAAKVSATLTEATPTPASPSGNLAIATPSTSSGTALTATSDSNTTASMNNTITLAANTGGAAVVGNTTGGSALSGNVQAVATVANLLQSAGSAFGPDTAVFSADINGDVNGDFMFDPAAILAAIPPPAATGSQNLQVNAAANTTASIHNQIDIGATSGYATVANNTKGGDAASGDANAVVNLMNVINSTVGAGHSFIGTLNINGDLNGDILLPPGVLDALIASSGPAQGSTAASGSNQPSTQVASLTGSNTASLSALTNITADAVSGAASVANNTAGGNASSGDAASNITVLNLTGSNVIGKNSLLVFVNVLGKWVGMIMNAPEGSTSAALAGDLTSATATPDTKTVVGSTTGSDDTASTSGAFASNSVLSIVNDIYVHARSGDASVAGNTNAGNAKSGDAKTAVNVLNVENSSLSLSDWFGVLFINVFGAWNGSFGINTAAGDPVPTEDAGSATPSPSGPAGPATATNTTQVNVRQALQDGARRLATFVAGSSGPNGTTGPTESASASDGQSTDVMGYTTGPESDGSTPIWTSSDTGGYKRQTNYLVPFVGFGLAMLILVIGERDRLFGSKQKQVF